MGYDPLPADYLEMWQWIRTPLPSRQEHRDFEVFRRPSTCGMIRFRPMVVTGTACVRRINRGSGRYSRASPASTIQSSAISSAAAARKANATFIQPSLGPCAYSSLGLRLVLLRFGTADRNWRLKIPGRIYIIFLSLSLSHSMAVAEFRISCLL